MTSFDNIASKYFPPVTRCHHFYFLFSLIWVLNQPVVFFNRLCFLTPEHFCKQPISASNWSVSDIVNLSIPFKENPQDPPQIGQPFSPCTEYDIDRLWPLITKNTTVNEALNIRSVLYPNLTVRECSQGVQFIPSPYLRLSIAQDFETVCHNRYQISLSNSVYLIGTLVGNLVAGPLGDNFGRRPVVLWSSVIAFAFGLLTSASVNMWMYTIIRFLIGLIMDIAFIVATVLLSEWVGKQDRNSVIFLHKTHGTLIVEPVLLLLFYLIQNWRWSYVALCYPVVFIITGFYAWLESPRWLLSQGRIDECFEVIKISSSRNGKLLNENELSCLKAELVPLAKSVKDDAEVTPDNEAIQMIEINDAHESKNANNNNSVVAAEICRNEWRRFALIFRDPGLRRNFIVVVIIFFLEMMLFYGVKFYSIRLQGNPYIIALLTGLIGIPGNILQWIAYRLFDRKWPMVAFYGFSALSLGIAFILMWLGYRGGPIIGMATASMLFIDGLMAMIFIRVPEMFPASQRATALGVSGSIARFGSIAAMYVEQLDEMVWAPLPLLIFTSAAALAFFASFFMPSGKGEMLDAVDVNVK